MLKSTSIIMKFIVWIINYIHIEFNDIHWEGCLHKMRRDYCLAVHTGFQSHTIIMTVLTEHTHSAGGSLN